MCLKTRQSNTHTYTKWCTHTDKNSYVELTLVIKHCFMTYLLNLTLTQLKPGIFLIFSVGLTFEFSYCWSCQFSDSCTFVFRCELRRYIPTELSLLQGAQERQSFLVYSNEQMSFQQRQFGRLWRWSAVSPILSQHRAVRQGMDRISEVMVDVAGFKWVLTYSTQLNSTLLWHICSRTAEQLDC